MKKLIKLNKTTILDRLQEASVVTSDDKEIIMVHVGFYN